MSWETRPGSSRQYYTRTRKVQGQVIRQYLGNGAEAERAAAEDARRHAGRLAQTKARRAADARWRALLAPAKALEKQLVLLQTAALFAAGCLYHRGAWRRPRHDHH